MSADRDLFADYTYPDAPGYKRAGTSSDAARGIEPKATTLRYRVLAAIRAIPDTPEGVASRLREPVMNVRPRCSELGAKGLIEDSGKRGRASGGRRAIIWRAVRMS